MHPLQTWFLSVFDPFHEHALRIPAELPTDLDWWLHVDNLLIGCPFSPSHASVQVITDASPTGWGPHCGSLQIHTLWSPSEVRLHINQLDMLTVIKAFRALETSILGIVVQVVTDNTTIMYYVQKQGVTHSPPSLPHCLPVGVVLHKEHLPHRSSCLH